jgi:hypothetical protein
VIIRVCQSDSEVDDDDDDDDGQLLWTVRECDILGRKNCIKKKIDPDSPYRPHLAPDSQLNKSLSFPGCPDSLPFFAVLNAFSLNHPSPPQNSAINLSQIPSNSPILPSRKCKNSLSGQSTPINQQPSLRNPSTDPTPNRTEPSIRNKCKIRVMSVIPSS